jgi:hypothetical protein
MDNETAVIKAVLIENLGSALQKLDMSIVECMLGQDNLASELKSHRQGTNIRFIDVAKVAEGVGSLDPMNAALAELATQKKRLGALAKRYHLLIKSLKISQEKLR